MKPTSLLFACLLLTPALSQAAVTMYNNSADFMAALVTRPTYTEDFSDVADPTNYSASGLSYTIHSGDPGAEPTEPWTLDGAVSGLSVESTLTFDFTSGNITALGGNFYQLDIKGKFSPRSVSLTMSGGTVVTFTPDSESTYRGFVAGEGEHITFLTFEGHPDTDIVDADGTVATVDNLTVAGAPVPEPAGTALAAMAGLTLLGRRRRSAAAAV